MPTFLRPVSLRLRAVLLAAAAILTLLVVLEWSFSYFLLIRTHQHLRDSSYDRTLAFAQQITEALNQQATLAYVFSTFDEIFDLNPANLETFLDREFAPSTVLRLNVRAAVIADNTGAVLAMRLFPPSDDPASASRLEQLVGEIDQKISSLPHGERNQAGLVEGGSGGLYLLASNQILRSDATSEPRGYFFLLSELPASHVSEMLSRSHLTPAQATPHQHLEDNRSHEWEIFFPEIKYPCEIAICMECVQAPLGESSTPVRVSFRDIFGTDSVTFHAMSSAFTLEQAQKARWFIILPSVLGFALPVGLLFFILDRFVLRHVAKLTSEVARVGSSASGGRIDFKGESEFGVLANGVNAMLEAIDRSRADLARNQAYLQAVLDGIRDGVCSAKAVRGADGTIEDFAFVSGNEAALRVVGRARGELLNKSMRREFPTIASEGLFESYCQVVETGERFETEFHYVDHQYDLWLEISASKLDDGLVIAFSNITEAKKASQRLSETLDELERFNAAMLNREGRILEMKAEVNSLLAELGRAPRYPSALTDGK